MLCRGVCAPCAALAVSLATLEAVGSGKRRGRGSARGSGRGHAGIGHVAEAEGAVGDAAAAAAAGCSELVFLGTGPSTGTPRPICVLRPELCREVSRRVSEKALAAPPRQNKHWRNNPSLLIRWRRTRPPASASAPPTKKRQRDESSAAPPEFYEILIDAGKTFRESVLTWFPVVGVKALDAMLISHSHADACHGLDDVRMVQAPSDPGLPVFMDQACFDVVTSKFGYLVPEEMRPAARQGETTAENASPAPALPAVKRFVSRLDFRIVEHLKPFDVLQAIQANRNSSQEEDDSGGSPPPTEAISVTTLPVQHGSDMISMGFYFGTEEKVAYISDVSEIPEPTMRFLKENGVDVLILDCLSPTLSYPTHINLGEALAIVRELRPARTFFVGMGDLFDHDEDNAKLAQLQQTEGLRVQLAHDGLRVPVKL